MPHSRRLNRTVSARRIIPLLFIITASGCGEPLGPDSIAQRLQDTAIGPHLLLSAGIVRDASGVPVASLVFTNTGANLDTVFFGVCAFAARLYATSTAGPVLWESISAQPLPCISIGQLVAVSPGQARAVTVARIAAGGGIAAPPSGTHLGVVAVVANGKLRLLNAGQVTTP